MYVFTEEHIKGHLNKLFYIVLLIDLCSILKMIYKTENKAILFFLCLRKRIDFVNETELGI